MIPRQEPLPLTIAGCVITAGLLQERIYVEGRGLSLQSWYRWMASCGAEQDPEQRSSHPDLAVERGLSSHVCEVAL